MKAGSQKVRGCVAHQAPTHRQLGTVWFRSKHRPGTGNPFVLPDSCPGTGCVLAELSKMRLSPIQTGGAHPTGVEPDWGCPFRHTLPRNVACTYWLAFFQDLEHGRLTKSCLVGGNINLVPFAPPHFWVGAARPWFFLARPGIFVGMPDA